MDEALSLLESSLPNVPRETRLALLRYASLAVDWNHRLNLSGAKSLQSFIEDHVLDCVAAYSGVFPTNYCDVGSGAGLPGLIWAILEPKKSFILVDSLQKRSAFLQRCISLLKMSNARVFGRRFESLKREDFSYPREFPFSCVSRGTASPVGLLEMIYQSPLSWERWIVFSSEKTHDEFLTLSKSFGMRINRVSYQRIPSRSEKKGILTEIVRLPLS